MTHYDLFKLLHVVGAIAWVGGGIGLLTLNQQIISSRDYATLVTVGRQSQSLGMWLFMPAALVTVVFGVALVATEPAYRFGDLWILVGFGGIVASGIVQMAVAERAGKRFLGLVARTAPSILPWPRPRAGSCSEAPSTSGCCSSWSGRWSRSRSSPRPGPPQ